jgi:TPR repeat protein
MALYVKLGGTMLGLLTIGVLTLALKPNDISIATLTSLWPTQSDVAQANQPNDDVQAETTGSLSESALRDAARRRLAIALAPPNSAAQNPVELTPLLGVSPAGIVAAGTGPADIAPAGLTPTGLNPAGLNPAGLSGSVQSPASTATTENAGSNTVAPVANALGDADQPRRLAERAEQALSQGDITGARLLLERATAADGNGKALFMLAQTYDPKALARMRVRGITGDPQLARNYYSRALSAGVGEAQDRLTALAR